MTSEEALKMLESRCRFFAQDYLEIEETYEAREVIKKDLYRLKKYKKIEKELGIDLAKVCCAVYYGIWFKKDNEIFFTDDERVYWADYDLYVPSFESWFSLRDYGKTWALTMEELEK